MAEASIGVVAGSAGYGNSVLAAEACDRMGVAGLMMALSRPGPDKGPAGYAADAVRVVRNSGLPNQTDAMFTTIEGE